jgi:hypothetical protein
MFRKNKYGARKTKCALGHNHPSALEASVCQTLQLRQRAGDIKNIKYIATVHLAFGVRWKVDFSFEQRLKDDTWVMTWCEAKGFNTADFKIKLKMWREGAGPGPLELWKGSARAPKLVEIIIPKQIK